RLAPTSLPLVGEGALGEGGRRKPLLSLALLVDDGLDIVGRDGPDGADVTGGVAARLHDVPGAGHVVVAVEVHGPAGALVVDLLARLDVIDPRLVAAHLGPGRVGDRIDVVDPDVGIGRVGLRHGQGEVDGAVVGEGGATQRGAPVVHG